MITYSLDWLAGLITGEGCFTLSVNRLKQAKGAGWLRITPVFAMTMTDIETMKIAGEAFKAHGMPLYFQDGVSVSKKGESRPTLAIHLNGQTRLMVVTDTLLPHLYGKKKEAAQAVNDFCKHRLGRTYRGVDDFDIECVERVRAANASNGHRNTSISDLRDYKLGRAKPGRYSPNSERKPERLAEMTSPVAEHRDE